MQRIIQQIKWFFTYISPLLVIVGLGLPYFGVEEIWLRYATIILTASTIGFYTNFIAIKMLFRPHRRSALGRQGLIPQQKQKIAQRLGESINDEFFNAHEIAQYLRENRLPEKFVSALFNHGRQALLTPENIQQLSASIQAYLQKEQTRETIAKWLEQVEFEDKVIDFIQNAQLAGKLKVILEREWKQNPKQIENLIDKLCYIAAEYIPEIAESLVREFEGYIDSQSTLKRSIVNFMGWTESLTEERVREQLYRFISTDEFREALYQLIDKGIADIQDYLGSEDGHQWAQGFLKQYQGQIADSVRTKGLPLLINGVTAWLQKESSIRTMQYLSIRASRLARERVHQYVMSESFDDNLKQYLPRILRQLKLDKLIENKVSNYQSQQLETLIMRATGEHLVTIEVLGGLIGGVTGIALINPVYFGVILVGAAGFLILEHSLDKRRH